MYIIKEKHILPQLGNSFRFYKGTLLKNHQNEVPSFSVPYIYRMKFILVLKRTSIQNLLFIKAQNLNKDKLSQWIKF